MSDIVTRTYMGFRLAGDLPPTDEVTRLLGVEPTTYRRKGEPIHRGQEQQPVDVWIIDLIQRSEWEHEFPLPEAIARAVETLQRITPGIAQIDRSAAEAVLWVSTIPENAMSGFAIPTEIVAVAAAAQLQIGVSVLITLDDDEIDNAPKLEDVDEASSPPWCGFRL